MFAAEIRQRRVNRMRRFRHWRWHLDEMFLKINGERLGFGLIRRSAGLAKWQNIAA